MLGVDVAIGANAGNKAAILGANNEAFYACRAAAGLNPSRVEVLRPRTAAGIMRVTFEADRWNFPSLSHCDVVAAGFEAVGDGAGNGQYRPESKKANERARVHCVATATLCSN